MQPLTLSVNYRGHVAWDSVLAYPTPMQVHFTPEIEAKLTKSAAEQGQQPDEWVQQVITRHFDEEGRFLEAVRVGEAAIENGDFLTHEQVGLRMERFRSPDEIPSISTLAGNDSNQPSEKFATRNGVPLLPIQPGARSSTLERIKELDEETP